jgi:ABC-type uncharacterized transport system permease subunit
VTTPEAIVIGAMGGVIVGLLEGAIRAWRDESARRTIVLQKGVTYTLRVVDSDEGKG